MSDPSDYDKQRRNTYGEAPHAARKAIPRRKQLQNKRQRRVVKAALETDGAETSPSAGKEARVQNAFRKHPDEPLGRVLVWRLVHKFVYGMLNEQTFRAKLEPLRTRYSGFVPDYRLAVAALSHYRLSEGMAAVLREYV